jgi:hypothetical protein
MHTTEAHPPTSGGVPARSALYSANPGSVGLVLACAGAVTGDASMHSRFYCDRLEKPRKQACKKITFDF